MMNPSKALATLLNDGVIYPIQRDTMFQGQVGEPTTVLYVLCSDVFAWGCADAETLPYKEIVNLYDYHIKDKYWGAIKWCCIKRNEKPQEHIVERMKKAGVWDEKMENLHDNQYDKIMNENDEEE